MNVRGHSRGTLVGTLVGALMGPLVGTLVGPLVGTLVDPLVGSNFAVRVLCASPIRFGNFEGSVNTFAEKVKVRQENITAPRGSAKGALSRFLACREIILLNLLWGVLLCFLKFQ